MNDTETRLTAYRQAVGVLPIRLQRIALALSEEIQLRCEEIRLRAGHTMAYSETLHERSVPDTAITEEDLQEILSRATRYSVHSFDDSLKNGFVTLEGGHRLGLCGTAILRDGNVCGLRGLSSVNLRIAAQKVGAADSVIDEIWNDGRPCGTLIVSPPEWGKTTLLRDCVRQLSCRGIRIAVADERCELSGSSGGVPQFDLGETTDVLSGAPKAAATMQLLKTMSPAVIALDEITAPADVTAALYAANCGAAILATAHALNCAEFYRRALYEPLTNAAVFSQIIEIQLRDGVRTYRVVREGES